MNCRSNFSEQLDGMDHMVSGSCVYDPSAIGISILVHNLSGKDNVFRIVQDLRVMKYI